jgi:hypothetical protein
MAMSGPKQRRMPTEAPSKTSRVRVQGFENLGFGAPKKGSEGENARILHRTVLGLLGAFPLGHRPKTLLYGIPSQLLGAFPLGHRQKTLLHSTWYPLTICPRKTKFYGSGSRMCVGASAQRNESLTSLVIQGNRHSSFPLLVQRLSGGMCIIVRNQYCAATSVSTITVFFGSLKHALHGKGGGWGSCLPGRQRWFPRVVSASVGEGAEGQPGLK